MTCKLASSLVFTLCFNAVVNAGEIEAGDDDATPQTEQWAWHGQITNVTQGHRRFTSPYSGPNSLNAVRDSKETTDLTLFAGVRPLAGGELWINPELDQGFGLSSTLGLAGFASGEAYKIGANAPYLRLPRLFFRQVINFSGESIPVKAAANQLAGASNTNNLTLTAGKFSVIDIFDTNTYAHDPRTDFLNWAVIDAGAFDYAADAWGYTYGAAAEWTFNSWTLRGGVFDLSTIPNGKQPDTRFHQYSLIGEIEERHKWQGHDGKLKFLLYVNHGRMADYQDALRAAQGSGNPPDVAQVRHYSSRPGATLNFEQDAGDGLGLFLRASINDGRKEAYEFTEINKSLSAGFMLRGGHWQRNDDEFGLAMVVNGLSSSARSYFSAGGLGILIGDGALNYGSERIVEAYYSARVSRALTVGLDYQYVANPAYNRDRGPVSIYGFRAHAEF